MAKAVVSCPACSQKLRVPTEKGSILVTCSECSLKWMWEPPKVKTEEPVGEKGGIGAWFGKTARTLTGSSAQVALEPPHGLVTSGDSVDISIKIAVAASDLVVKGVRLDIVGEEIITLPWHTVRRKMGAKFDGYDELWNLLLNAGKFQHAEQTFSGQFRLAGPTTWKAGETQVISGNIRVPDNALPSFNGRNVISQWRLQAIVETSGTNPKSDWHPLLVGA